MKNLFLYGLAALAAGCTAGPAPRPEAEKPERVGPDVVYRSAFDDYAGFREQELADWRLLNDEVARAAAKERP